jgi:hypothetical protein
MAMVVHREQLVREGVQVLTCSCLKAVVMPSACSSNWITLQQQQQQQQHQQ